MAITKQAGTYQQPLIIIDETASKLSKGLEKAGESFIKQNENIRLSKDAVAKDIAKLNESMSELGTIDDQQFPESARLDLENRVTELNNLMLQSIGRDQSEVIQKQKEIETLINQFGTGVGMVQADFEKYKEAKLNGNKKILNTTDPNMRLAFEDMLTNGGANWRMFSQGGSWVMKYTNPKDGKESVINIRNYLNAKENGAGDLIKYTDDKSPDYINEAKSLPAYGQVADLTKKIQTAMVNGDDELVTTLTKDLTNAYNNLKNAVSTNTTIQSMIDENDWQNFEVDKTVDGNNNIIYETWKNLPEQRLKTQNAVTSYIMNQLMPTDAQGNPMNLIDISVKEEPRARASESDLEKEKTKRIEARLKANSEGAKLAFEREQREGRRNSVEYDMNRHLLFADEIMDMKLTSEERADRVAKQLNEAAAGVDSFEVRKKEGGGYGVFNIETDEEVQSMDTRNGIIDTLNDYTILAFGDQKDLDEKSQMIDQMMKQDELQKAFDKKWANAKKGDIVVGPDGKKYKKP